MEYLKRRILALFEKIDDKHDLRFFWLGGLIGCVSAVLAIAFREFIDLISYLSFGIDTENFPLNFKDTNIWMLFLVPTLGGTFVAWFTNRFAPEAKGHGVPEIMEAVATRRGEIRPRVSLIKLFASSISIGSGFSVGREGPTALIGATIGSFFGQILNFPINRMKMVVGCGAAAGIAATFNAPLAGTVFALELIVGSLNVRYLTPIVFSAMAATVISHHYFGNVHPLFTTVTYDLKHPYGIALYGVLGALAGLVGALFTKLLYASEERVDKLIIPVAWKGFLGGFGIFLCLVFLPAVSGPGTWAAIDNTLSQVNSWKVAGFLLLIVIAKIIATSWSLAFGASGGVFAPALLIGGNLGAAYGYAVNQVFKEYSDSTAGYALVGMGAVVAAVTQAPLTAITIIFELTNNMTIVLPLIVSSAIGIGVFNHLMNGSIYTLKLKKKGLDIERGKAVGILAGLSVDKVMKLEDSAIDQNMIVKDLIQIFEHSSRSTLPIVNNNTLVGLISFWDLRQLLSKDEDLKNKKVLDCLSVSKPKYVTKSQNLYDAFGIISSGDYSYIPVVASETDLQLVGRLMRHSLLEYYKNQLAVKGITEDTTKDQTNT